MSKTKLERTRDEIVAEIERRQAGLFDTEQVAEDELQKIAADVALDAISQDKGEKRRAAIEGDLGSKRDRLRALREAVPEIERRLMEEQAEKHRAALRSAANTLAVALKGRHSASRALARSFRDLTLQVDELERHRKLAKDAEAANTALLDGEEFVWPENVPVDEEWEVPREAIDFLSAGPIRPIANEKSAAAKAEAARELQDSQLLGWFQAWPNNVRRAQLPAHLRDSEEVERIVASYDEKLAQQERRPKEREREREAVRLR